MTGGFKAILITRGADGKQSVATTLLAEADLMDGDVTVSVEYTTVNHKDGLAITGRAPVVRRFPMVPGIDFSGTVLASSHPDFSSGDKVVLNGWGVGETHFGGYARRARVKGDWLVHLADGLSPRDAMAIGTAGYAAMLSVMALERHGIVAGRGPVVVTGAAGGVGSVAIALLSGMGYRVVASTGRPQESAFLEELGAAEIIHRDELSRPARPLGKERWAGGIDTVGGQTLAGLLSMTAYGGAVAACGLAGGMELPSSVAPFVLRGVSLLGIDSVMAPKVLRTEAWQRLARELDHGKLAALSRGIAFDEIVAAAEAIVDGRIRGRVVVEV